jgi:hypothetical protein
MAMHYGVGVVPARPYKPRDRAKVESGVQLAERWIIATLRNRKFFSIEELNQAIRELRDRINQRPFRKREGSRATQFAAVDKPAMGPLPAERFDLSEWSRESDAKETVGRYRITPEKWQQDPYGKEGGGFWVVALIGTTVVWYNDIEEGFNRSCYSRYGFIDDYWCNQDELEWAIQALLKLIETGEDTGRFGPPQTLDRPAETD